MSESTIPELDDAVNMELGVEADQDISKVPDRIRIFLIFVGEALILCGAFFIVTGLTEDIQESIWLGIGLVVAAVFLCIFPIIVLELKKYQYAADLSAADSQTQMQDYDWWEQIDIEEKELVMVPAKTLDGNDIIWDEEILEETISTLKMVVQKVGGKSQLNPTILDQIVDARIKEIVAESQETNILQRGLLWLFRIKPMVISKDFKKLADDWVLWTMDQQGLSFRNRVGIFSMHYDDYIDSEGEIVIAPTERFQTQTFRRNEEEDLGEYEETPCSSKAWEIREIREFEERERERNKQSWFRRNLGVY